jgi:hypothetical protein
VLVVLGVLLGLASLLAIPVHVAFRLEAVQAFTGRLSVRWLFGVVRFEIRIPGAGERPHAPSAGPRSAAERPRRQGRARSVLGALRQPALRLRVQRLAADLVRASHLSRLRLRMRLGLGDPADTGRLWAFVGPLGAIALGLRGAEVRIEPEFVEPVLEFQAQGRMLLVPLQVLTMALGFVLSPASIRAWRTLRSDHG